MTEPVMPAGRRTGGPHAGGGLAPLLVATVVTLAVAVWLVVRDPRDVVLGYLGSPVAMLAAAWSLQRLGATVVLPRPVRAFWRQLGHAAAILLVSAGTALALANNDAGMSLYVAVPLLLGMFWAMSAFLRLPLGERTPLGWARILLDCATVAVAGALVFWYVVLSFATSAPDLATRATAGTVGVAALLCLVVIGKAAAQPAGPVDPLSLRMLTIAPIVAVGLAVLLIAGNDFFRLTLSVIGSPLVALAFTGAAHRQRVLLRRGTTAAPTRQRRSAYEFLPFFAVVATAALVTSVSAQRMNGRERAVIVGAVLITALVVARQLLGLRENRQMLSGLREQQAELERLAMTDPLTGLANRTRFSTVLTERLAAHRPATVLLIDIDDFKTVNDTMGPAVGDQLLYQVAQRLRLNSAVRELPARLGGDEFAVLLDVEEAAVAEEAAGRILRALTEPFRVG